MDLDRFTSMLRSVSQTPSRRDALRALAGAGFGAATPTALAADQAARKGNRRDPCRGHDDDTPCGIGKRCCGGRCIDVLGSVDHCGHCGNVCGGTTMVVCIGGNCCNADNGEIGCMCTVRGGACGLAPKGWTGPPPCCNVGACTSGVCPCS